FARPTLLTLPPRSRQKRDGIAQPSEQEWQHGSFGLAALGATAYGTAHRPENGSSAGSLWSSPPRAPGGSATTRGRPGRLVGLVMVRSEPGGPERQSGSAGCRRSR